MSDNNFRPGWRGTVEWGVDKDGNTIVDNPIVTEKPRRGATFEDPHESREVSNKFTIEPFAPGSKLEQYRGTKCVVVIPKGVKWNTKELGTFAVNVRAIYTDNMPDSGPLILVRFEDGGNQEALNYFQLREKMIQNDVLLIKRKNDPE